MIRIDSIWLATEPMDMRAGTEAALAKVIAVFGAAQPQCADLFARRSEQMNPEQASLLDDLIDTDIAAIEAELQALQTVLAPTEKKQKPKRTALPAEFPRTLIHHEPDNTYCPCGRALKLIGEDVSEKLDYTPGVFTVERHVRGKWAWRFPAQPWLNGVA